MRRRSSTNNVRHGEPGSGGGAHDAADLAAASKSLCPARLRAEMFGGRQPPLSVQALMRDPAAVARLLGGLPGVSPQAPCVRNVVAALAGA